MKKEIPYSLLAKYFSGQCAIEEKEEIERWRTENEALFHKLKRQWESVHPDITTSYIPDKILIWQKIQSEINMKARQVSLYPRSILIRVSGIVAAITILITASLFTFVYSNVKGKTGNDCVSTIIAPAGQKSQMILADGTAVWLNSGSTLSYTNLYGKDNRKVSLEGEAYFEVKPDLQNPFIVQTGELDVKVHGTSFNVQAYRNETDIRVSLLTGSVSLLRSADQFLLTFLEPNQSAVISKDKLICSIASCDAEIDASWHLNKLKFEGATAEYVWKKVERWYGVTITLENVNSENKYWFSLKTESLTELLRMMDKLTPIEYQLNGEEVKIRYK